MLNELKGDIHVILLFIVTCDPIIKGRYEYELKEKGVF